MTKKEIFLWIGGFAIGLMLLAVSPLGDLIYRSVRPADQLLDDWRPYRAATFMRTVQSGRPVLVEVYASWCPSCMAQHKAFESLRAKRQIPDIDVFRVDFDRDADFLRQYDVRYTSTLIVFRSGREVDRATGLVDPDLIETFLRAAVDPAPRTVALSE